MSMEFDELAKQRENPSEDSQSKQYSYLLLLNVWLQVKTRWEVAG